MIQFKCDTIECNCNATELSNNVIFITKFLIFTNSLMKQVTATHWCWKSMYKTMQRLFTVQFGHWKGGGTLNCELLKCTKLWKFLPKKGQPPLSQNPVENSVAYLKSRLPCNLFKFHDFTVVTMVFWWRLWKIL